MKTDELIKAIVADNATVSPPIKRTVWLAVAMAIALAAALFFALLKVRSDFLVAIVSEPRFMFKFAFTLGLGVPALILVRRLAKPDGAAGGWLLALFVPLVLLLAAVVTEMYLQPPEHWSASAMGTMPGACMKYIPLLSFAPLISILWALRNGAPANPMAAGAAAGLLAAAIGATFYATFCVDDSPMFLAIWYVGGIAIVTAVGAVIGHRVLRW